MSSLKYPCANMLCGNGFISTLISQSGEVVYIILFTFQPVCDYSTNWTAIFQSTLQSLPSKACQKQKQTSSMFDLSQSPALELQDLKCRVCSSLEKVVYGDVLVIRPLEVVLHLLPIDQIIQKNKLIVCLWILVLRVTSSTYLFHLY